MGEFYFMSNMAMLSFLQNLKALEVELSTLLSLVEDPEEHTELFSNLISSLRARLEQVVNTFIDFSVIGNSVTSVTGEGDQQKTTSGLPIVSELMVSSLFHLCVRLILLKSDNLTVSKDLLGILYKQREVIDTKQVLPSLDRDLCRLLVAMSKMHDEFNTQRQQQPEHNVVSKTPDKKE